MATHIPQVARPSGPGPLVAALGQCAVLTLLAACVGLGRAGWLVGSVCVAVLAIVLRRAWPRPLAPADWVTLARAVLVGGVAALVADGADEVLVLAGLAAAAWVLDAVDGPVARATGTACPLGARFDMEVDAFLILLLSAFLTDQLGIWVLTIGLARYLFGAARVVLPPLRGALSTSRARKVVAAGQGIVLVVATSGVLPGVVSTGAVGAALTLLLWSFGRDAVALWRGENAVLTPAHPAAACPTVPRLRDPASATLSSPRRDP